MANSLHNSLGSTTALEQYFVANWKVLTNERLVLCLNVWHVNLRWFAPSFGKRIFPAKKTITGRNVFTYCLRYHVETDDIMTLAFRHQDTDKFIIHSDDNTIIADW
jgi:hypothetical protein